MFQAAKNFALEKVIDGVAAAAANMSDEGILRMIKILRTLMPSDWYANALNSAERYVKEKHPGVEAARRISRNLSPHVRKASIRNFVLGVLIEGNKVRKKFYEEEGFNAPPMVMMSPTSVCNYKCYGCYADGEDWKAELEPELIHRVVAEAQSIGSRLIAFTGGEPFLRKDLMDIMSKHRDVMFSVYTNGSRVTPAMLDQFAEWGNVHLSFSLEGPQVITDDRRGAGAFGIVMHQMDECKKRGLFFGFGCTVSRKNLEASTSDEFVQLMVDKGAAYGWYLNLMPTGPVESQDLMLTAAQRYWMRERSAVIRKTHPIFLVDFVNESWLVGGCMAGGRKMIHINSNGDVEPCMFIHYAVDNIKNKSIREVLRSDFMKKMREAVPHDARDARPCMIIDHPDRLRNIIDTTAAFKTTPDAGQIANEWAPYLDAYGAEYGRLDAKHIANVNDPELVALRAEMPRPEVAVGVEVGKRYGPRRETEAVKTSSCGSSCATSAPVAGGPQAAKP
ncbi:MAG: radical SAM protein [Planctomycetes bacterium]|nr:radical SAM protein [Planctomycetota bacterium]